MDDRFAIYTPIHKGQRRRLSMLSTKAGTLDYTDTAALDEFHDELSAVMTNLRLHAAHEEATIHPMLAGCMPGGAERLEAEHRTGKHLMENLSAHFEGIQAKSSEFTKRGALCLEFYLALNRFITFYLGHINEEEEHAQTVLWRYYTDDELSTAWATIIAIQSPEESIDNIGMMLPALNINELTTVFALASHAPSEVQQSFRTLAERVLSPEMWAALKSRIGTR
ncbi:MAG: hemerythrin domain-containing protein [Halobacteriota archaeon]